MAKKPTFAIVDDHHAVGEAMLAALENSGKFRGVGFFSSIADAKIGLRRTRPDIVITDWRLNDGVASALAREIRPALPDTKWLLFTAWPKVSVLRHAISAGIRNCVSKSSSYEDLIEAIELVLAGETYYCVESLRSVLKIVEGAEAAPKLGSTEEQILCLISEGLEPKEIANRLKLSLKTVHNAMSDIRQKLSLSSMVQLARFAVEEGIAPPV